MPLPPTSFEERRRWHGNHVRESECAIQGLTPWFAGRGPGRPRGEGSTRVRAIEMSGQSTSRSEGSLTVDTPAQRVELRIGHGGVDPNDTVSMARDGAGVDSHESLVQRPVVRLDRGQCSDARRGSLARVCARHSTESSRGAHPPRWFRAARWRFGLVSANPRDSLTPASGLCRSIGEIHSLALRGRMWRTEPASSGRCPWRGSGCSLGLANPREYACFLDFALWLRV